MRCWKPLPATPSQLEPLPGLIEHLGSAQMQTALIRDLHDMLPAASYAIYRTGGSAPPQLFLSASHGVPDRTHACWRAYCAGIHRSDLTFAHTADNAAPMWLSHITAEEVAPRHRQSIYEAHGLRERLSVSKPLGDGGVLALNYYRHSHQSGFSDRHIANFESISSTLLAVVEKHLQWPLPAPPPPITSTALIPATAHWQQQLQAMCPPLTEREMQVCLRLLQGMTYEGIASDLHISSATVKTYRNRAFARLGIHFRNQLFGLLQPT